MAKVASRPRLNKGLQFAVRMAQFAKEHDLDPSDVVDLIALAQAAFKAGENYCNEGDRHGGHYERANDRAHDRATAKAREMGFEVYWPGLVIGLKKDGREVYLPLQD